MTVVNEVGVDPNRLLEHPHTVTVCLWTGTKKGHFSIEGTFLYQSYFELGVISVRSR